MLPFIIFALWTLYSMVEGMREADYYSMKVKAILNTQQSSKLGNEHVVFTIQRVIALVIAAVSMVQMGIPTALLVILSCIFCFPFFHDGAYYVTRHKLDGIYPDGWLSQSTTSTAVSDKLKLLGPVSRTACLVISLCLLTLQAIKF